MLQFLQAQSLTQSFCTCSCCLEPSPYSLPLPASFPLLTPIYPSGQMPLQSASILPHTSGVSALITGTGIADHWPVSPLGKKTMCLSCSFLHSPYTNSHSRWAIKEGRVINMQVDEPRRKRHWTGRPETWVLVHTSHMKCAGLDMSPLCSGLCLWILKPREGERRREAGEREDGGRGRRMCKHLNVCVGEGTSAPFAPHNPHTSWSDSPSKVLPRAPLEGTLVLHNSAGRPLGAGSQEARARAPPPQPALGPRRVGRPRRAGGPCAWPAGGTDLRVISSQQKLRGGPLGRGPPWMWPILSKRALPGFDSRRLRASGPACGEGVGAGAGRPAIRLPALPAQSPGPRPSAQAAHLCALYWPPRPGCRLAAPSLS